MLLFFIKVRAQTHTYPHISIHTQLHSPTHDTTGWRRLIGCLKLQVIFRKRATNYRALLWKMKCTDKASYISSPPCTKPLDETLRICTRSYTPYTLTHSSPLTYTTTCTHSNTLTHSNPLTYTTDTQTPAHSLIPKRKMHMLVDSYATS